MADTAEPTPPVQPGVAPEQPGIVPEQPGIAKLKAEFLLKDYKPVLDTEYISSQVQEQLNDAREEERTAGQEPPTKRVKLKGRNKQRPKHKKIDSANKLCPAYINEKECRFGDKCKFSHDKKAFLESQPDNVGSECYLFETYGKCPYGVTCRFSKSHLTEDLTNVAKDDITDYKQREAQITNVLKKDLQVSLWKRRYDFSKADNVLDDLCPGAYDQRRRKEKPTGKDRKDKLPEQSHSSNTVGDGTSDSKVAKEVNTDQIQDKESNAKSDVANGNNLVDCDSKRDSDSVAETTGETCDSGNNDVDRSSKETAKANDGVTADKAVISESTDVGVENTATADASLASHQQESVIRLRPQEKKKIDFKDKLYLAPLTTVGNLPFRRICKGFGADVTCGEMAVCTNLLQGQQSEWALLKRHVSEDLYGVQLCGAYPDSMTRCAQLITENMDVDFIDINCGCPIDLIFNKGEGSALMGRPAKFEQIVKGITSVMDVPLTVKLRTGIYSDKSIAHTLMPKLRDWGVALTTLHGRSRVQRYTKTADWSYINECALAASPMPLFGNGDILSYEEAMLRKQETGVSGLMIARGALIKPWIFTEIKEQRHWDISSSERLDILREYCNFGFDHWGSDTQGVENTRRFLLEWLSFLYRYIPVGVLERVPQQINERPPYYKGRDDLETLMASPSCGDWIKISEMLLGPVPAGFTFLPKHKANAYK